MPMDGVMLGFVARQLDTILRDGRVDRVIQPEKDEIHLMIRSQGANHRLVLSAAANAARVHLSEHAKTGPMEPPMLCMLFRKYLCGGRVLAVRRIAGDRILEIDVSNLSELGDPGDAHIGCGNHGQAFQHHFAHGRWAYHRCSAPRWAGYLPRASGDAGLAVCLPPTQGKA